MSSINRVNWIDYAKAIGITLVVYGHVARGLVKSGLLADSVEFRYIDSIIYTFHMPLFFFLSGLFLLASFQSKGFGRSLGSKVDTIIYPYIIWSLLQGGVEVLLSSYTNGDVSLGQVLSLFSEPRAQFWYLYALFFVFLVSLLSLRLMGVKALYLLLTVSVSLYLFQPKLDLLINIGFITNNLVFFLAGAVFQQLRLIRFNCAYVLITLFILSLIGQFLFHDAGFIYHDKGVLLLSLSLLTLVTVVSFAEWLSRFNLQSVAYVGASSMAIYLMHILAGSGVRVILDKVIGVDSLLIHLFLGTLLAILFPLLALKVINHFKIPYVFSFPVSHYWQRKPNQ